MIKAKFKTSPPKKQKKEIAKVPLSTIKESTKKRSNEISKEIPKKDILFKNDNIIKVSIGNMGIDIGLQYYSKVLKEHSSFENENASIHQKHHKKKEIIYESNNEIEAYKGIFVDYNNDILSKISQTELANHFPDYNFVLGDLEEDNNYENDFKTKWGFMKTKLANTLRRMAEQCDSLEGFMVFHSAFEEAGSELGLAFFEIANNLYEKKSSISFPIYDLNSSNISSDKILVQALTTVFLQECSTAIIPIEINEISNRLSHKNMSYDKMLLEYKSIAEIALMLSIPLRRNFNQSMSLPTLLKTLVDSEMNKFLSSNMFPFTNYNGVKLDDLKIAEKTLLGKFFGLGSLNQNVSLKNLIVFKGNLQQTTRDNIHYLLRDLNNNSSYCLKRTHTTNIIQFNPTITKNYNEYQIDKENRMLFCGNSTAIIPLISSLLSKIDMKTLPSHIELLHTNNPFEIVTSRYNLIKSFKKIIQSYENLKILKS